FRRPPGKRHLTAKRISQHGRNLERADQPVKQKTQATADFLGVLGIPAKVVRRCGITTTSLTGFNAPSCALRPSVAGRRPPEPMPRITILEMRPAGPETLPSRKKAAA